MLLRLYGVIGLLLSGFLCLFAAFAVANAFVPGHHIGLTERVLLLLVGLPIAWLAMRGIRTSVSYLRNLRAES